MKKVINGKTYNTETATFIAEWDNGLGRSDFKSYEETLYRSPKGQYFIHGEGGAMTRWSRPCGNMTCGGEGIILISADEALQWCERHDVDVETISTYFAVEEG